MKRTRLRPVSRKRRSETKARAEVRRVTFERAGYQCQAREVWLDIECGGPLDCHEIVARSAYPGGHLDPSNTLALCRRHHDAVDAEPLKAAAKGLKRWSWERKDKA